jgi:hypothetical protein
MIFARLQLSMYAAIYHAGNHYSAETRLQLSICSNHAGNLVQKRACSCPCSYIYHAGHHLLPVAISDHMHLQAFCV